MPRTLKNWKHFGESLLANLWFGFPGRKLVVIGVTGTDGKTTTSSLIAYILSSAGFKVGLQSTLSSPHMTTPGGFATFQFLNNCVKEGKTHAVLEITSHAINQNRIWGIPFSLGVLTNIADQEHLDYHGSFGDYRDTKLRFLAKCTRLVANADDKSTFLLKSKYSLNPVLYSIKSDSEYKSSSIEYSVTGTKFTLANAQFRSNLIGDYNLSNTLAAIATAKSLGISYEAIFRAVSSFKPPPGRLEVVTSSPFTVIVDFAHTPQAFENVLPWAEKFKRAKKNKLIHVFGATGNRYKEKRPLMAKIAAKYDDYIFLTHEDTYSEDLHAIVESIETGLIGAKYHTYQKIFDRREAIRQALLMAKPGDVVILTGVGHQQSMNIAGKEVPWSEMGIVEEEIRLLNNKQ